MLNLEDCGVTTGNMPARSPYGRAGFQPRRKRTRLRPPTACAAIPAQSPPYGVDFRALCRCLLATEFLIATHPSSETHTTDSKHRTSLILIATVKAFLNSPHQAGAMTTRVTRHRRKAVAG